MLETYTHGLVNFLNNHPSWGTAITFIIAFTESLAVIGTIIPGSVTMTAIGALVGAGVMPAFWTFFVATMGALCGDMLSYWAGRHYDEHLAQMWPFRKHPEWLEAGKAFFAKHGAKSVVIGRFFGPVRSIVPTIAGLLHMTAPRFIFAALPSAFLWAIAYMVPGVLIGALSAELPAGTSAKFIVYILIFVLAVWLLFWMSKLILSKTWSTIDAMISRTWQAMRARPAWHFITTPLADAREPDLHEQLILVFASLITAVCLILTLYSATHAGFVTALNVPVYHLLQSIRAATLDNIMAFITILGQRGVMTGIAIGIFIWLAWYKHYRAAVHWVVLLLLITISVYAMKLGFYSPRPHPELVNDFHSSLPSGHTAFVITLFGFLAFLIARELSYEHKPYPYFAAGIIIFFVGLSRLYLGLHWFSDVLTSLLLGLLCVMLMIISYRRRHTSHLPPQVFATACGIIIAIIWLPYATYQFRQEVLHDRIIWPNSNLTLTDWFGFYNPQIPILRYNRLGKAIEPLNIQWQGELPQITKLLEDRGWVRHSIELDIKSTLKRLSLKTPQHRLPLLAHLYHNHHPALLMTKSIPHKEYFLVLYLWPSDLQIAGDTTPLWLGNIELHAPTLHLLPFYSSKKQFNIVDVIPELIKDLDDEHYYELILPQSVQDSVPKEWQWQGKILQIKSDN